MGPKRSAKTENGTPTKKPKLEPSTVDFCWEFEGDKRTWTQYGTSMNKILVDAHLKGTAKVDFKLDNGHEMSVDLKSSVQKNKKTGWERPVRVSAKDPSDGAFYVWKWEDEKGNYNPYSVENALLLEEKYQQNTDEVEIQAAGRSYLVDIPKKEQKNKDTGVVRKISRTQSGLDDPDDAQDMSQQKNGYDDFVEADDSEDLTGPSNINDDLVKADDAEDLTGQSNINGDSVKADDSEDLTEPSNINDDLVKADDAEDLTGASNINGDSVKADDSEDLTEPSNINDDLVKADDAEDLTGQSNINGDSVKADDSEDLTEPSNINDDAIKADPSGPEPTESSGVESDAPSTSRKTSSRGKSGKVKEEPQEEEEVEKPKAAKSGGKGKSGRSGAKERPAVKTMVMSGKAPVDTECSLLGKAHVFYEGSDVYDCMLNQTNVSNNKNRYFLIQLLEEDSSKNYYTWFRWGRVGYSGQNNLEPYGPNLEAAKKQFMKKFQDKTKNKWANRKKFVKVPGKYDMLEMDYTAKGLDETDAPDLKKTKSNVKVPDSKLDKRLQSLIDLICDIKTMKEAVLEMQYDAKNFPLDRLNKDQIKAGYSALKKIDACVEKKDFGSALTQACDEFYTKIPHDFGMRPPTEITTKQEVKNKIALLEALDDIEIAIKMLKEWDMSENPIDRQYHALKCDMEPVDATSEEYTMINQYLQNTNATTHNQYSMKILDMFCLDKHGEAKQFNDVGNRLLLWHCSRLTNWVGILSHGLRIAPPEAPVTGYMFGKGVYFADMSSKSANYCFATKTKNVGLLLLCDVALGNTNDLLAADYSAHKLPAGKHSVKGAGSIGPDPSHTTKTPEGALVPWGKPKNTGVKNPSEFIVYDTRQIRMKYLLKVQFNFK